MKDNFKFTARTSIQKVGNSKGIILSGKMLAELDLVEGSEVEVSLSGNGIQIVPVPQKKEVSSDVSDWGNQFKAAIKACDRPDPRLA
jgi:antitoxin component of MazEF toxin-antitoxin module